MHKGIYNGLRAEARQEKDERALDRLIRSVVMEMGLRHNAALLEPG